MTLLTKFAKQLVATKCLALFFYNFKDEDIKDLCTRNWNFKYAWGKLEAKMKAEKWDQIYDYHFNNMYSSLDFETQEVIMQKAFELYEEEVLTQFNKKGHA